MSSPVLARAVAWAGSSRRVRPRLLLAIAAIVLAQFVVVGVSAPSSSAGTQAGAPQVVVNPGGGVQSNGSDGLKILLNSSGSGDAYVVGQDQIYFANTVQYCCSAGAPMLNIGGELFGQAGPAYSSSNWTSIAVSNVTGSTTTSTGTASGSGSVRLTYTATKNALSYVMVRDIAYTYPNMYFTDSYTFTIPPGNSDVVKFYLGGDTAPGSSDQGYGIMLTDPVRSVISLNTASHIQFGMREIAGNRTFTGARSGSFYDPYPVVESGGDIVNHVDAFNHDAGLMVEWALGSTPGTITAGLEQFVVYQEASLTAQFRHATFDYQTEEPFDFNITNTLLTNTTGNGFTFAFPNGMTIGSGAQTNTCGGTVTAVSGSHAVTVSGVNVAATSNCVVTVPMAVAAPGTYAVSSASASSLAGDIVNRVGNATVTATSSTNSAPTWVDQTLGAMAQTAYYNDGVVAAGWPLPTFSVTTGALPAGLALDTSTGTITGTPTTAGAYGFTITATNSEGSINAALSGTVTGAPTAPAWTDDTLAAFQVAEAYSDGVAASGSPSPTYAVSAGSLPAGVSLDTSTGAVTGTPTTAGAYSFTLRASNGVGSPVTRAFSGSVEVADATPGWTDQTLGEMQVGEAYSDGVSATGHPAVTYSVSAGSLPAGLTLDTSTGAITGTPTTAGPYSFTLRASNGVGTPATLSFSGTVEEADATPAWTDHALADFQVGAAYADGVAASGHPAVTYSVSAGSLPAGVSLHSSTGAVTGTPTTAGPYSFTLRASNGVGSPVTQAFSGTVAPAPVVDVGLDLQVGAPTGSDGAKATVHGEGLLPFSPYVVVMHSDPIELARGNADATGSFDATVTIPADAPFGAHELIVSGTSLAGEPVDNTAWFSVTMEGTIGDASEIAPVAAPPSDLGFVGLVPSRLLDTRDGGTAVAARSTHELVVLGKGGVPADATSVVLNVAVDQPATAGFVTVFPCGTERPLAANVNFAAGETASNEVTVRVDTGGRVCVYTSATTHVVVDVDGAYSPSAGTGLLAAVTPARLLDTREAGAAPVAGTVQTVVVTGRGGVPADATAVVLNVAVDQPTAAGFVTAWPCGTAAPLAASLNFAAGETTSNTVVSKVGTGGAVCLLASATTHVVVDVEGAYVPGRTDGHVVSTDIARLLDTRDGAGTAVAAGSTTVVQVAGVHGVPSSARAAVLNVAVDQPAGSGFVTVSACDTARPWAAGLSVNAGLTSSNAVTTALAADGTVCIWSSVSTHLVVDVDASFGPLAV